MAFHIVYRKVFHKAFLHDNHIVFHKVFHMFFVRSIIRFVTWFLIRSVTRFLMMFIAI